MWLAMSSLAKVTNNGGLTISETKTKAMVIDRSEEGQQHLTLGEEQIEVVDQFKYLGSVLHHSGMNTIARASQAYGSRVQKPVCITQDEANHLLFWMALGHGPPSVS